MARRSTTRLAPGQADREPGLRPPEDRPIETSALEGALAATVDALRGARALCEKRDALLRPDLEAAAVSMTAALGCLGRLRADGLVCDDLSASVLAAPAEAIAELEHVFGHATARYMPAYLRMAEELGSRTGDEGWDEARPENGVQWTIVWPDVMANHPGWALASDADREAVLTMHALEEVGLRLRVLEEAINSVGRADTGETGPF